MGLLDVESIDIDQITEDITKAKDTINEQLTTITNLTPSAGYGMQDAKDKIEKAKQDIKNRIDYMETKIQFVDTAATSLLETLKHAKRELNETIQAEEAVKKKVEESKNIFELRKTQSESLQTKNEGNFHTSWLGLWRPLTEESRLALFVVSIVFGIISVISIIFIFSGAFEKLLPAFSHLQNPFTTKRFFGGFYKSFIKKNK